VAHSAIRIAAGAGAVAASLLIVGPNPAGAAADEDGQGSYSENDDWNGAGATRGTIRGTEQAPKTDLDPPQMKLGTSGSDLEDDALVENSAPEGQVALRSAAVVEQPAGDNELAAALPRLGSDYSPQAGSDYSRQPVTAFRSPRVVVGNGRIPGTHVRRPGSATGAVLAADAPVSSAAVPAAPTAIEINIPPLPPPLPPVERIRTAELVVGEFGTGTVDSVTDPLAGAAGLILIPAVGAVLGYRQARAAQSLRESLRA
jgi:hypothetical protein